jgi:hypothetical protein
MWYLLKFMADFGRNQLRLYLLIPDKYCPVVGSKEQGELMVVARGQFLCKPPALRQNLLTPDKCYPVVGSKEQGELMVEQQSWHEQCG